jgi:hypothetical protein
MCIALASLAFDRCASMLRSRFDKVNTDTTALRSVSEKTNPTTSYATCELEEAIQQLLGYCRTSGWGGYDPYDALNSRLFAASPFSKSRYARLAFTQFMKKCPVNLRGLLFVPKQQNPKGLALFISALLKLVRLGLAEMEEAKSMIARLLELRSPGWDRYCWGYNFPWQTRTYLVPRGVPNIICTTFAGHALLDVHEVFGDNEHLDAAASAGRFLLESLHRTRDLDGSCFAYTPLDKSQIHNANLLGAAFLARLHSKKPSSEFLEQALSSARFSIARQEKDGSWPYGETPKQKWIDSFHTGYNLVALKRIQSVVPSLEIETSLRKGLDFFLRTFLTKEGFVKYYADRTYPIDTHALAYAIVTLAEFGDSSAGNLKSAWQIWHWTAQNMRSNAGYFFFQKWPIGTNRISYIRWCQAWMLFAMTTLMTVLCEAGAERGGSRS